MNIFNVLLPLAFAAVVTQGCGSYVKSKDSHGPTEPDKKQPDPVEPSDSEPVPVPAPGPKPPDEDSSWNKITPESVIWSTASDCLATDQSRTLFRCPPVVKKIKAVSHGLKETLKAHAIDVNLYDLYLLQSVCTNENASGFSLAWSEDSFDRKRAKSLTGIETFGIMTDSGAGLSVGIGEEIKVNTSQGCHVRLLRSAQVVADYSLLEKIRTVKNMDAVLAVEGALRLNHSSLKAIEGLNKDFGVTEDFSYLTEKLEACATGLSGLSIEVKSFPEVIDSAKSTVQCFPGNDDGITFSLWGGVLDGLCDLDYVPLPAFSELRIEKFQIYDGDRVISENQRSDFSSANISGQSLKVVLRLEDGKKIVHTDAVISYLTFRSILEKMPRFAVSGLMPDSSLPDRTSSVLRTEGNFFWIQPREGLALESSLSFPESVTIRNVVASRFLGTVLGDVERENCRNSDRSRLHFLRAGASRVRVVLGISPFAVTGCADDYFDLQSRPGGAQIEKYSVNLSASLAEIVDARIPALRVMPLLKNKLGLLEIDLKTLELGNDEHSFLSVELKNQWRFAFINYPVLRIEFACRDNPHGTDQLGYLNVPVKNADGSAVTALPAGASAWVEAAAVETELRGENAPENLVYCRKPLEMTKVSLREGVLNGTSGFSYSPAGVEAERSLSGIRFVRAERR